MAQSWRPDEVRETLAGTSVVKVRVAVSTRCVRPDWPTIGMAELSQCLRPVVTLQAGGKEVTVSLIPPGTNRFADWSKVLLKSIFPPPGRRIRNGALRHANRRPAMESLQRSVLAKYRVQLKRALQDPGLHDRVMKVRNERRKQVASRTVADAFAVAVNLLSTEEVAELWKQSIVGSVLTA